MVLHGSKFNHICDKLIQQSIVKNFMSNELKESRMKKIIIYLTIFSMLNLIGCYYQQQMTVNEYDFSKSHMENRPIKIIKIDSTVYILNQYDYQFRDDTLFIQQKLIMDDNIEKRVWLRVPLNEIQSVEVEKIDAGNTISLALVVTAGIVAIAIAIYAIAFPDISI